MNDLWQKILGTEDDLGPTIARLAAAIVMFPHGAQKAVGWFGGNGFAASMEFFTAQMGLPWIVAFLVIVIEFVGALALMVGAGARLAALGFIAVMIGAVFTVHLEHGFFMNWFGNQEGEGYEYHILMIALCLIVVIQGAGKWSLDRKLAG